MAEPRSARAVLAIRDLHVYYGAGHALQGVTLTLERGAHAVVGRNGMGKTTLCNAILGLVKPRSGSIRLEGREISGMAPHRVAGLGVGYTPQGRRLWRSLTVDEHLRMCEQPGGSWTVERVYQTFPRLAERRRNGGAQLSGGEQQMLAIGRALLHDPKLLVLDEPTEGLAPVIVDQVERLLVDLAAEGEVAILLVEQNIHVATTVAEDVAVMVNGRITTVLPARELAADRALQQRLLGVGRIDEAEAAPAVMPDTRRTAPAPQGSEARETPVEPAAEAPAPSRSGYVPPTRWSAAAWARRAEGERLEAQPAPAAPPPARAAEIRPLRAEMAGTVIVAGTFDTKAAELGYLFERLRGEGVSARTVDLSTSGKPSAAHVPPTHVAAHHPQGAAAVFTGDRGASVAAMATAFERWAAAHEGIAGILSAGGSGGTALVTPAMRGLPVGVPKLMISTVASGDVGAYVGPSDIAMMYSVADVQGLNSITRRVLSNGAHAMAGMVRARAEETRAEKPALGITMFGVTTTAVQQITRLLEPRWECLVFHATGVGGRSMEKLADSGLLAAAVDLTTTEICDMMMGGVFAADEDRFGAIIRRRIPYVGSVGALDMVNFGPRSTVPERYRDRIFVEHNPQVTLMRTTPEENTAMGVWIAERLNLMEGPVRFLIPERGVSALDAPGQPFHDPDADRALFEAIARSFRETATRRLIRLPLHINDPAFAEATAAALAEITPETRSPAHAAI